MCSSVTERCILVVHGELRAPRGGGCTEWTMLLLTVAILRPSQTCMSSHWVAQLTLMMVMMMWPPVPVVRIVAVDVVLVVVVMMRIVALASMWTESPGFLLQA
jgi:hypothetical protein